jgi:acetylornithine deacetylase/succinyl-diaminopimelate desuccinylase-like protein
METDDLRRAVAEDMPRTVAELERLVRIPSIGHPGYDPAFVRESAEVTAELLRASGVEDARLLELDGGHPAVVGAVAGPVGAPSVLLYAHHDVQPEGEANDWQSGPFEPVVRDGRLYGRGSADDKSGIAVHAAALRALGASRGAEPPVTVRVLVEGEEECSTEHLPELVVGNADLLRADVAVIADGGNDRTGVPTIGTSVRGVVDCRITVRVLEIAQHSGAFGGPIPDAITALCRIIATLHDERGDVAIDGLHRFEWTGAPVEERALRGDARVLESVELIGTGSIGDRLFAAPAVAVVGLDAPRVAGSSNQIVPGASARVSLRIAPGQDPERARQALIEHLRGAAPWGVEVEIEPEEAGAGYLVDTSAPAFRAARDALTEAFGHDVVEMGSGGSVPIVPMLAETFPGIAVLIWGAGDERSNYHSIDESVDLVDLQRLVLAEALFLRNLATT